MNTANKNGFITFNMSGRFALWLMTVIQLPIAYPLFRSGMLSLGVPLEPIALMFIVVMVAAVVFLWKCYITSYQKYIETMQCREFTESEYV